MPGDHVGTGRIGKEFTGFKAPCRKIICSRDLVKPPEAIDDRGRCVRRPGPSSAQSINVELNQTEAANGNEPGGANTLQIAWTKTPPIRRREILLPADPSRQHRRPILSDRSPMAETFLRFC